MKVALIGHGYWGKKIYSTLKNELNMEVVVVEKKETSNSEIRVLSMDEVLSDSEIDHCFLATPEETHFVLAKKCLEAGKNVFVEKPLCLLSSQARRLVKIATQKNLCVYVDYTFLFDNSIKKIKEILQNDEIGKVLGVRSVRHSSNIQKPRISIFEDLATHDLYLSRYFFGPSEPVLMEIHKSGVYTEAEEGGFTLKIDAITYKTDYSWLSPFPRRRYTLYGSKGMVSWEKTVDGEKIYIFLKKKGEHLLSKSFLVRNDVYPLNRSIQYFFELCTVKKLERPKCYRAYISDVNALENMVKKSTEN